jgi:hypothetical protein
MGARLRRTANATVTTLLVMFALVCSAWLAYASSAPNGTASYPPPTTTTTVQTTTTSVPKTTTTTVPTTTTTVCKPGYGYGDKNHCHSGPPGQVKKP